MKKKIISSLILTLILTSALNMAFIMKPSLAENSENGFLDKSASEQDKILGNVSQNSLCSDDIWHFNDTSEWSNIAYIDGNKTRLVIGVKGEKSENLPELEKIAAKHQAKIVNTVSMRGKVRAVVVELLLESVTAFVNEAHIAGLASYIEPNMKVQAQFIPNDPYWNNQWGPKKVEADWAWNTTVGSHDVLVAIIDTGIDYTHLDLADNYAPLGYDWVNMDASPLDDFGHGTHCAGIIAAALNNSVGIAGLAQVRVMAEKVLDSGGYGYDDWVANGIINATDCGADIISLSLGGYGESELMHEAVKYAYDAGVLVIAAAGNDNTNLKSYPAAYSEVIAISATDQYDNKAGFSNWGDWIELSAPGVYIYSTMPTYHVTMNDWGYAMNYDYLSGTSMACPHVSGVAALVLSLYPNKARDWVRLWLRCTADDLGDEGFDVYYGYGRVNARKAVEHSPPTHELIAYECATPPYVEPGAVGIINATILNFGENDETDVTVQLLANDSMVDSTLIGFLTGGNSTTVSLEWNPIDEGLYNVTLYVVPVLDEENVENNVVWKRIYVGFPVKAVVLHSAGNSYSQIIINWQALNNEWHLFGDTMVYIDHTTLNKGGITYEDIAATEADVLIISCAYDPYSGWQFTDSEIEAITKYVYEGHGLIATAGTLYYGVPNNNKLASLFGLNKTVMWGSTGTDLLHLQNTTHPIFANVPNPLIFPQVGTALPYDGRWDSNELVGGKYLALGHYQESAIVTYRGLVYISPWLEVIPPYYYHHLQLLYNAITWSHYQKPQHELVTYLQCPIHLRPGETVSVNATVENLGLNNETNVELLLLLDGVQVANLTVSTLAVGESATLPYLWTPTEGTYNVTAYAPPVLGEEYTFNNVEMICLRVSYASVIGFIETHGESLHSGELKTFCESLGHIAVTIYSTLTPQLLEDFDILMVGEDWSHNPWSPSEIAAVQEFILLGKGFVGIGDELAYPVQEILREFGISYTGYYGYAGSSSNFDHLHPIMSGVNSIYASNPVNSLQTVLPGYWIANDASDMYVLIAGSEVSGYVLCMSDDFAADLYSDDNEIMFANMVEWMVKYEHDLVVSLDAPRFLELGSSTLLKATVRNSGLNNETNVELYLLINGTVVSSETVSELLVKGSHTTNYTWTPISEPGSYNITAYAVPVPEEEYITNNVVTYWTCVFFYSKLHISHEWIGGGNPMGWHADDASWQYTLPFDFPFYGIYYRTIYISSNGLITFFGPDTSWGNSMSSLAQKLAIAPAWDDWVTYEPYDIYIWQNSTHIGIRWHVAALYNQNIVANFEAVLSSDGVIQLNYDYNNGQVSTTVGISNGAGHMLAEDLADLNYINTIVFLPYLIGEVHDVAVADVAVSSDAVYQGWIVGINVTVANFGDTIATFTVTLYSNSNTIATQNVPNLEPNTTLTLSFSWNTTGVPYCHNYTIKAVASTVPGETNTENNTFIDGQVEVKMLCDVNGDGAVDGQDIQVIKRAIPSCPDDPNWNPQADINNDGVVDGVDYQMTKKRVGKT